MPNIYNIYKFGGPKFINIIIYIFIIFRIFVVFRIFKNLIATGLRK